MSEEGKYKWVLGYLTRRASEWWNALPESERHPFGGWDDVPDTSKGVIIGLWIDHVEGVGLSTRKDEETLEAWKKQIRMYKEMTGAETAILVMIGNDDSLTVTLVV